MGHGAWSIEKNPKFAIVLRTPNLRAGSKFRNPQLNSRLLDSDSLGLPCTVRPVPCAYNFSGLCR